MQLLFVTISAIIFVLLLSSSSVDCASAPEPTTQAVGYWNVTDPNTGLTCIRMQAVIVLNLDYRLKDGTYKVFIISSFVSSVFRHRPTSWCLPHRS